VFILILSGLEVPENPKHGVEASRCWWRRGFAFTKSAIWGDIGNGFILLFGCRRGLI
jgi:hypothetical protein